MLYLHKKYAAKSLSLICNVDVNPAVFITAGVLQKSNKKNNNRRLHIWLYYGTKPAQGEYARLDYYRQLSPFVVCRSRQSNPPHRLILNSIVIKMSCWIWPRTRWCRKNRNQSPPLMETNWVCLCAVKREDQNKDGCSRYMGPSHSWRIQAAARTH